MQSTMITTERETLIRTSKGLTLVKKLESQIYIPRKNCGGLPFRLLFYV